VAREYSMTYFDVLGLPLTTFWSFNRQVDRLRAEQEQRQLRVLAASQSPEGARELGDYLQGQIGHPVLVEEKFDADKFEELKKKFSGERKQSETHTE
jgi:hypothetical protein